MLVTSIVVTFNPELNILKKQLSSISIFTTVILVDNFSKNINQIEEIVKSLSANISIIRLVENYGLAFAQNKGIEFAEAIKSSHIIFFDQDSYLSHFSFLELIDAEKKLLSSGINVGAIGPVCIDPISKSLYPITKYFGPFIVRKFILDQVITEASFIIASGSLVRTEIIRKTGPMMSQLFIDYIDVEWCYRIQSRGFKLYVTGSSKMEHIIGDSRKKFFGRTISMHSATRRYYLTRNCIKILSLPYIPIGYKLREIFLFTARILTFFYFSNERGRYAKLIKRAFIDAVNGNFGKLKEFE